MALTRSIVRASVAALSAPAEAITQANRLICADAADGMFVTLFYAQLNPATGDLTYVNAGHNPPLHYSGGQAEPAALTRTGMALGIQPLFKFEQRTVRLAPGDWVFFFTDGVVDAVNAAGEYFGQAALQRAVRTPGGPAAAETAAAMVASVDQALRDFTGATPPYDDITMMLLKRQ